MHKDESLLTTFRVFESPDETKVIEFDVLGSVFASPILYKSGQKLDYRSLRLKGSAHEARRSSHIPCKGTVQASSQVAPSVSKARTEVQICLAYTFR